MLSGISISESTSIRTSYDMVYEVLFGSDTIQLHKHDDLSCNAFLRNKIPPAGIALAHQ